MQRFNPHFAVLLPFHIVPKSAFTVPSEGVNRSTMWNGLRSKMWNDLQLYITDLKIVIKTLERFGTLLERLNKLTNSVLYHIFRPFHRSNHKCDLVSFLASKRHVVREGKTAMINSYKQIILTF